jgi:hypothetical protein
MEGEEFDALVADIKKYGLREKIVLYEGKILDGRNRYRALQKLDGFPGGGRTFTLGECVVNRPQITDPVAYVISKNIHHRHLTAEQKRDAIAALIKAQPEKSDRQIAEQAKVSHPTVAKVRREAEATGKALPVEKRVGKDGKARKQPTKKTERTGLFVEAHEQGPPIELPPPAPGYVRHYQHHLEHGTCHLLPETEDIDRKGCKADGGRWIPDRDEKGRVIPAGPWRYPDGHEVRYRKATPEEKQVTPEYFKGLVEANRRRVETKATRPEGNGHSPEASAEARKAHYAALEKAGEIPTEGEAEAEQQATYYTQACWMIDDLMTDATRQKLFAHIEKKYAIRIPADAGKVGGEPIAITQ